MEAAEGTLPAGISGQPRDPFQLPWGNRSLWLAIVLCFLPSEEATARELSETFSSVACRRSPVGRR
jgi:hypothetical protein